MPQKRAPQEALSSAARAKTKLSMMREAAGFCNAEKENAEAQRAGLN
jgi:hypothetical protein